MTTAIQTKLQPLYTSSHPQVDSGLVALTTGLSLLSAAAPTSINEKEVQLQNEKSLKDLGEIAVKAFDQNLKKKDGELDIGSALKAALLSMIKAMGEQQLSSALNETKLSQLSNDIGQALSKHIKEVGEKQLDKIEEAERKQKQASLWQKIGAAFSALIGAVLIATGVGVGAGVMMIASAVLMATGALEAITNAISKGIESSLVANGMDKEKAKQVAGIIAAVIVTVAIAIVGAGVGSAGAIAQGGLKAVLTSGLSQLGRSAAKNAVAFGTMGITQTGLTGQIMRALPDEWFKDKKTKELVAGIVTILVDIILMLVSLKIFTAGSSGKEIGGIAGKLQKLFNLKPEVMAQAMQGIQLVNTAGLVGSGVGQGAVQINLSKVIKILSELEAETSFLSAIMKQVGESNKERTNAFDTEMETMQEVQKSVNQGVRAMFAPVQA